MLSQTRGPRRRKARSPRTAPESVTSTGCASAGRPVGSQGRPARQRISVRAFAPTKASRPSPSTVPSQTSSPSSRSSASASDGGSQTSPISERPSSSDGANGAGCSRLADPAMRDQLDDAAGRVVEVDRLRVPVREVEHGLAGLTVGQELEPVAGPGERRIEAVARHEEREVVERRARRRSELEHGLPDLDRQPAIVATSQWQPEQSLRRTRRGGQKARRGIETDVAELERHRADSITRRSPDDRLKSVAAEAWRHWSPAPALTERVTRSTRSSFASDPR